MVGLAHRDRGTGRGGRPGSACGPDGVRAVRDEQAHAVASLGDPDFDLYRPSEEHELLREAVRELADDKIAPRAAEIDETGEFPWDVYEALVAGATSTRSTSPRQYGGAGADAARGLHRHRGGRARLRCVLADPGGQQARHAAGCCSPGREELKAAYLPPARHRRGDVQLRAVRARGRQRRRGDAHPGRARRRRLGASTAASAGSPNAGVSKYYTVMAVTDPDAAHPRRHLRVRGRGRRRGLQPRCAREEARHQGLARRASSTSTTSGSPADRIGSARSAHGFRIALAHARPHPRRRSARRRSASRRARSTTPSRTSRSASSSASRSREFQGMQFMLADMAIKVEAARAARCTPRRRRASAATPT